MKELHQIIKRLLPPRRWSLLALSVLAPLILLSVGLAGAEQSAPDTTVFGTAADPDGFSYLATRAMMSPQSIVSGTVVNPDGSTITDTSWVCLVHLHPEGWTDWDTCKDSESNGSFSFAETIPSEYLPGDFFVQADAPWDSPYFCSLPAPVHIANDSASINMDNITLTHASFAGMVYEPGGTTLATEGWVSVEKVVDEEWHEVAGGEYLTGTYAVGGVPAGDFMLVAHPPEDSLFWGSEPISVTVDPDSQYDPDATQPYSLTLQDPNLTGEVVYPDSSLVTWIFSDTEIVGRAWVLAEKTDWTLDVDRPTASWGEFGLRLPPGDYRVSAGPEGTVAVTYTQSIPRIFDVSAISDTGPLTLTYPSFTGPVYDPDGSVVTECLDIWLEDMAGEWIASDWYCPPEGLPYYQLGGVPTGDYWLMTGSLPELSLFPADPEPVYVAPGSQYDPDATQIFTLTLTGAQLEVFVEDPAGNPVPARVVLWDDQGYEDRRRSPADGSAQFGGLEHGDYWIQAWPHESDIPELANSHEEPIFIGPGFISRTLALRSPDVIGVVETPEGDPLPPAHDWWGNPVPHPAEIHVHTHDWSIDIWATTNMTGEFSLALPNGGYDVLAYPMHNLTFSYTKSQLESFTLLNITPRPRNLGYIRLTYPRIVGTVVDPDENRVSTSVNLWSAADYWDEDDTFWYGPDDPENKPFRFGGMPPGHYYVQADPPWDNPGGYGSSNIYDFYVPPAGTEPITLTLGSANFVGDLWFPPDSDCPECPVPWVDVRVRTEDWSFEDWTTTGEDGRFAFSGLDAGDYLVEVFLWGELLVDWDPPPPEPFSLASSTDQVTRTLYLTHALRTKLVTGTVVYDTGEGVDDALVYAHHEGSGRWADMPTESDGSYELYLGGGLWKMGVEPRHPGVDWYFDPAWERWVWFPFTPTLEVIETVNFTVTRATFFEVTGGVDDPNGDPPPEGTTSVDLCTDEGRCFGAPVEASGRFTVLTLPGAYHVWVHPGTGLLPPLDNGFPIFVDGDLDLGVLQLRALADRTARVSGRVIISPTGQGLAGVVMEAWTDEGDWASTETITDGNYALDLFPGHWHGGPVLSPEQREEYVVLPPRHRHGHLEAGETIANVNFFLRRRDATIRGQVVDGVGNIITDTALAAVAFAEFCPPDPPCRIVDEAEVQGGTFELRVVGGVTYTLGVWLQSGGYMPGPPVDVHVGVGETKTGVQLELLEAGTRIHGHLLDGDDGSLVEIEASVYGSDSEGNWAEDALWPEKDPYEYNLYVPTPETGNITWTLGLWVDPSTGYIPDPAHPSYEVVVPPGDTSVLEIMYVQKLDTVISGTVRVGTATGDPTPYIWVFAEGVEGTDSEGLYFEAETDENGEFSMIVLSGEYLVSAYLPPHLVDDFFPPLPGEWDSADDNPIILVFRPRPTGEQAIEIIGTLSVSPTGSLADDVPIYVFGSANDGSFSEVTGTLASGYRLPVISGTTWYVWAAYEDPDNDAYYYSQEEVVTVGSADVPGVDLVLEQADFDLPDTYCWTFDPSRFKRLSLPAQGDLPEPLVEIQAGTIPVTGTVEVCATPKVAVQDGQYLIGFAYEMEARDSQGNLITEDFDKKVRLIFYFDEEAIGDANPEDLEVVFYSTTRQEWVSLDDVFIDLEDMFATGKIDHFSKFGVFSDEGEQEHRIYLPLVLRNSP